PAHWVSDGGRVRVSELGLRELLRREECPAAPIVLSDHESDHASETQARLRDVKRRSASFGQPEMLARAGQDGSRAEKSLASRRLDTGTRPSLRQRKTARFHRLAEDGHGGLSAARSKCASDCG